MICCNNCWRYHPCPYCGRGYVNWPHPWVPYVPVPYVPYIPAPLPRPRWPDLIDRVQRYKPVVQRPNLI